MNSGGFRGFTVVTIVTLMFAPVFEHHHWLWKFVGRTEQTQIVKCEPNASCPRREHIVNIVSVPSTTTTSDTPGPRRH
jgi:hypothetical protein